MDKAAENFHTGNLLTAEALVNLSGAEEACSNRLPVADRRVFFNPYSP